MTPIRRGIEVVITGLTRNQFVPKAHEGSNPSLCAKDAVTPIGVTASFLSQSVGSSTARVVSEGSHIPQSRDKLAYLRRVRISSPMVNIPLFYTNWCNCIFFVAVG